MQINECTIIQISAETYSGFQYKIPKVTLKTMSDDEIILEVRIAMKNFFKTHNMYLLESGADALKLHFHEEITTDKDIVYLCDHCN